MAMLKSGTFYAVVVLALGGCGAGAKAVPTGTADPSSIPTDAGPMVHSDQEVNFGKSRDADAKVQATTAPQ
jgi:hypothetical protein